MFITINFLSLLWTVPVFKVHDRPIFNVAPFERLSAMNVVSAMGLGFLLALLIFIDQNIVVSLTNAPENRWEANEFIYDLIHNYKAVYTAERDNISEGET